MSGWDGIISRKKPLQCMEIDENINASDLPRYLVWDAQLDAAFRQIDKLLDLLMMMSEVSPAAFGLEHAGRGRFRASIKIQADSHNSKRLTASSYISIRR